MQDKFHGRAHFHIVASIAQSVERTVTEPEMTGSKVTVIGVERALFRRARNFFSKKSLKRKLLYS